MSTAPDRPGCRGKHDCLPAASMQADLPADFLAGLAPGGAALVRTVSVGESSNAGYSSTVTRPAAQASGDYVFACVNSSGKIDYLEFRLPLPHQCWFSGETLWHLAAVPAVDPVPSASPSPSA